MKLEEPKLDVQMSGIVEQTGFKIHASAKAFRILSSGLYSNKIRSIIRELSTNAFDSQVVNGNPEKPFKVHLPNALECFFSVRDFGTGLSHEDIVTTYSTYFYSNKTQDDSLVGCMGLGSKSPFAYCDNFTVTDYFNGKKHTYAATIGENGSPIISLIGTEETNEPNGLEVTVAVKPADFYKFREEAQYVYNYFKVRPEIVGATLHFEDKKPIFQGEGWKVYQGSSDNTLIMGQVAYPLNLSSANCKSNLFNHYSIEIEVGIGEVEMTASRESLEYTEKTINAIKTKVDACVEVFKDELRKELEAKSTYWEACVFYSQNSLFLANASWQGKKVVERIHLEKALPAYKFEQNWNGKVVMKRNREINVLYANENVIIVENDLSRGAIDRTRELMKNVKTKTAYLVTFTSPEQKKEFFDTVGVLPANIYKLASSLPKPVRDKQPRGPLCYTFNFVPHRTKAIDSWERNDDIDIAEGGVYVELEHWNTTIGNQHTIGEMVEVLKNLGYPVELVGIRKKLMPKVEANPDWVSLENYLKEVVKKFESDYHMAKNRYEYTHHKYLLEAGKYINNPELAKLIKQVEYAKTKGDHLQRVERLIAWTKTEVPEINIDGKIAELKQRYPLLFEVLQPSYDSKAKALAEYVAMVDEKNFEIGLDNGAGI